MLALAGLYGVISYSVAQRTRELGIRLALGAQVGDVLRLVLKQGMTYVLVGEVIGIAGAYALAVELARSGGDPAAFARYETRLRGFIEAKQKLASRFGGAFCPATRFGVMFRNKVASLLDVRPVADLALSATLKDEIELPAPP